MKPRMLLAVLFLFLPARAAAQERTHAITIDDYFTQADLFEAVISPDGKHVAYTEGRWQESTDDRKSDIWVVPTEDEAPAPRRLTFERANDHALQWSPDSQSLYFLGSRKREGEKQPPHDGTQQVWRLRVGGDGPQPFAVTRVEGGVSHYAVAPDGQAVYYTTDTDVVDEPWRDLKQKYKSINYGHGKRKVSRLWKLDLQTWRAEKLLDEKRTIRELKPSPAGDRLAMITTPDSTVLTFEGQSRVDVLDLKTGEVETLPDKLWRADAPSPYAWLESLAWSSDGKRLAFCAIFDAYPAEVFGATWTGDKVETWKMPRPEGVSIRGYGSPLAWISSSWLCFLGEKEGFVRLYAIVKEGVYTVTPGDVVVNGFTVSADGKNLAVVQNDTTHLPDIFLYPFPKPAEGRRLTDVNPQTKTWKLPKISKVTWTGANGDAVEGILELPPDYKEGQRVPLVVAIHGGPTAADHCHLQFWIYGRTLLPAKGYAVLCPNYRGSTGYGDKFLTDLVGNENDLDVKDILAGVDALVERGIADPERLGVMGWSNGGYLTNCIITHTDRFKAASSGAGILDTAMEWGINDEPAYPTVFKTGFPWQKPQSYRRTSPSWDLGKVRTPTLIHVGGNDERCPPEHSRMLHRALHEYVKVPCELLVYPGEPHGLTKYSNRKAKMEWDLAWFDRYILGKSPD